MSNEYAFADLEIGDEFSTIKQPLTIYKKVEWNSAEVISSEVEGNKKPNEGSKKLIALLEKVVFKN